MASSQGEKFCVTNNNFPDGGQTENVFNLTDSEISSRSVDLIDVVRDQDQNYVAEEVNTQQRNDSELNILLRTSPCMSRVKLSGALWTRTGWRLSVRDVSENSNRRGINSFMEIPRKVFFKPICSEGDAIMCAYKLCKVEFRYWGMQSKIERFIHDMALRNTMLRAHRQAWVWQVQLGLDTSLQIHIFHVRTNGLASRWMTSVTLRGRQRRNSRGR